jgi:hypothetical protein
VDPNNQRSSFTQHDASVHTYFGVGPGRQFFLQALLSRRADRSGDGQTLWQIARSVAPADDPRDTVDRIRDLNGLGTETVQAGQRLVVPG